MKNSNFMNTGMGKVLITVILQGFIFLLSIITGFILPKYMGAENYGYYQIYIFYIGYVNLLGIGFNDGIALRYSGQKINNGTYEKLRGSIRVFILYLIFITVVTYILSSFVKSPTQRLIYQTISFSIPWICMNCVIVTIFLARNKTGLYNISNIALKLVTTLLFIFAILKGASNWQTIVNLDIIVRILIGLACIFFGYNFIFGKRIKFKNAIVEFKDSISCGFYITLGVVFSSIMPIISRVVVEYNESIAVYGMYSFALSLLGIVIMFTSTAGTVVFPILKFLPEDKLKASYNKISDLFSAIIYIGYLSYIPVYFIIIYYMPEYFPILKYVHICLAMCLPIGKIQLLITPYFKAVRQETYFFKANIIGLVSMILGTFSVYYVFKSLIALCVASLLILFLYEFFIERHLKVLLNIKSNSQGFADLFFIIIFTLLAQTGNIIIFSVAYIIILGVYFKFNWSSLINNFNELKRI